MGSIKIGVEIKYRWPDMNRLEGEMRWCQLTRV